MTWTCKKCGSENIMVLLWMNPNTGKTEDITNDYSHKKMHCLECKKDQQIKKVDETTNLMLNFN